MNKTMPMESQRSSVEVRTVGSAGFLMRLLRTANRYQEADEVGRMALLIDPMVDRSRGERRRDSFLLNGKASVSALEVLSDEAAGNGVLAPAARAILVEATDPELFYDELEEARRGAAAARIPDNAADLFNGTLPSGPISAVDLRADVAA